VGLSGLYCRYNIAITYQSGVVIMTTEALDVNPLIGTEILSSGPPPARALKHRLILKDSAAEL